MSGARARYIQNASQERVKGQCECPVTPQEVPEADARRGRLQKITQDAAAKMRAKTKEKEDKAAEKQHELVKAAAVKCCG